MTDEALEQRLRAFYRDADSDAAPVLLRRQVSAIADAGAPSARRRMNGRSFVLLAAAALLTAALVGGAIIGASLLRLNSVVPPSPSPAATFVASAPPSTSQPSPSIAAQPSPTTPSAGGSMIAFMHVVDIPNSLSTDTGSYLCISSETICPEPRVWLVGVDGTNPHELVADGTNGQSLIGWSPDGSRLLYSENGKIYLADASGSELQAVDTGCTDPCQFDSDASFSADGQHLVFERVQDGFYGVATMDLATGQVVVLSSTMTSRELLLPGWSPDGTQIVFWRPGDKNFGNGPIAPVKSAVFVVDVDGQNVHQISPLALPAESPAWSPDGARIVFTSTDAHGTDVYTMRPDGSDVRQLTTNGASGEPSWTPNGRILFSDNYDSLDTSVQRAFWIMDADGANPTELIPGDVTQAVSGGWWQPDIGSAIVPPPWVASTGSPVGPPAPTPQATPVPSLTAGFSWTGSTLPSPHGFGPDTATLLPNDQVLVTMGCDLVAELYDPHLGMFNATGTMLVKRGSPSATLLADGRVLIAGGYDCSDGSTILASAELYDPGTGAFSATGTMIAPRSADTATLLNDGRVLIAGGITNEAPPTGDVIVLASYHDGLVADTDAQHTLATAELYDPSTGTFAPTGSMADYRSNFTATLLQDGRVLVAGGGGETTNRASAELYDPNTGTFSPTGSMVKPRMLHTATLLDDGLVLIAGGRSPNDLPYASAEIYDPSSGSFTATGQMEAGRQQHTATLLQDGRVLIAGGYTGDVKGNWNLLASTEIYDPVSGKFRSSGSMGDAREDGVAVRLADGSVLICGGEGIGPDSVIWLSSAVLYQ